MNKVGVAEGGTAADASDSLESHESDAAITLGVLNAVSANSALTQRNVARQLGIALGLANAYLKRCARKGWIKINQVPHNRYAYYLTPTGFAEKSRLTAQYLTISFNFFRSARRQCADLLAECTARGWQRVALAGVSDLAEIATLCAAGRLLTLVGIVERDARLASYAGLRIVPRLDDLGPVDAVIITEFGDPQAVFDELVTALSAERVLAPALLNISRIRPPRAE